MTTSPHAAHQPDAAAAETDDVLRIRKAGKRFRSGWALRDLTLTVRRGSITALLGPNGAGKTTLLRAVSGLLDLTEGTVSFNGRQVSSTGTPEGISFLAQDKPLYRRSTVADMLQIARHLNARWDAALARRLCDEAELNQRARVGTLSGGQRSRLALAIAFARRPELLLLDEPLADLDPLARLEVQQTLLSTVAEQGTTVVLSSHILGEIEHVCSDLAVITDGRVSLRGETDEVIDGHTLLIGPGSEPAALQWIPREQLVEVRRTPRQTAVLLEGPAPLPPPGWSAERPSLDEIVVAQLRRSRGTAVAGLSDLDSAPTQEAS